MGFFGKSAEEKAQDEAKKQKLRIIIGRCEKMRVLPRCLAVVSLSILLLLSASALASSYLGNTQSMKFHYYDCRTIKAPEQAHFIEFESREDAIAAGYKPCGVCRP